jgi:hypothetical protein
MWNLVAKDSIMNSITGEEAKVTPSTVKASSLGGMQRGWGRCSGPLSIMGSNGEMMINGM